VQKRHQEKTFKRFLWNWYKQIR